MSGPPALQARAGILKRDDTINTTGACDLGTGPAVTSSASDNIITPAPTISCDLHEQDSDQGILKPFCLCDNSVTLTPLSVPATGHQSDSCAYTAIPGT
ncbi:MAG: hypothetical protein CL912_25730 [Deltaproteobacteria bacterium]|nr:hypothetical protein [Deltaproteobacteria bacterium]MAD86373.1 hypothetical protein [Deltaproteobacteria bacterium]